ncbi:hypothetical protein H113_01406 [Trichophyton rubrum MR1459]|uniref:Uncharacterized protein n=1 Tax=Trichophyton rubrum (strain ATCC MYA-4607 / CBS 118892) TaxID=559305 RepID=A0A080WIR8_TRIRC|nr:uncharacterized protein TERG_12507 [Trichophyton rubrum CBS 118892]EZF98846.1 hypothetical protein H113_01406 [Trichophyton rubrum MR1459]EZG09905.1 hypothetical protein H106_01170 [Trichophyton rubrum CBS 735.88]KFL62566.1 hypothetical protein TERG_12507 [Trichophyton rubrum CBS 118892]
MSMWISSIKRMMVTSEDSISFSTFLIRSSNWPWYEAPAIRPPMSRDNSLHLAKLAGTSELTIRLARPSTTVVFPTPGSPTRTGLFFVRRLKMRITLRISSSRPMTGSIFPSLARAVMSTVNFFSHSFPPSVESAVLLSIFFEPRISVRASSILLADGTPASLSPSSIDLSCASADIRW